jgi:hypothetical protein
MCLDRWQLDPKHGIHLDEFQLESLV